MNAGEEKKGTGPICRNGPEGAAHKLDPSPFSRRMIQLLSAEADGWLEAEERRELLELLRRDPRARAAYAEQAILHSLLFHKARCGKGRGAGDEGRGMAGSPAIDVSVGAAVEHPVGAAVEHPVGAAVEHPVGAAVEHPVGAAV
ncbi:MAG: hypothetical protein KKE86_04995, partial [Planctomycetes bacterium]|nr:hypothetical protein [Planctomycetota bacterium]